MFTDLLATTWWSLLLRGIVALLFGVMALAMPGVTLIALTVWFAAFVLIDGVFLIAAAAAGRKENENWWLMLIEGIAALAFGFLALWAPGVTALVLLMYIAAYAAITGILRIVMAVRLRKEIEGEWWLGISGVAGVIFGALIMAMPGAGALAMMVYIGVWALVVGGALCLLAFRVRKLARRASGRQWRGGESATAH